MSGAALRRVGGGNSGAPDVRYLSIMTAFIDGANRRKVEGAAAAAAGARHIYN
jgi:hypothetical protein